MHFREVIPRFSSSTYVRRIVAIVIFAILPGHFSTLGLGKAKLHLQVFIMGGGTSHNFTQSYQQIDSQTLSKAGETVRYADSWAQLSGALNKTNVLIQASNQMPPPAPDLRNAIMTFVNTGGGLSWSMPACGTTGRLGPTTTESSSGAARDRTTAWRL